ncbi:MAG: hypothetical protein AVDCRST_MAG06-2590, partial [uncultured Nocardioides sp.]
TGRGPSGRRCGPSSTRRSSRGRWSARSGARRRAWRR